MKRFRAGNKGLRRVVGLTGVLAATATALLMLAGSASAVTGAVSTTHNPDYVGPGTYVNQACLNGQGVNCNIYLDKRDVWLSGLPVSASLGAGDYFFAVLVPGGQPSPNDGGVKNLSDLAGGDEWTNRAFSVDGDGNITAYAGTHERSGLLHDGNLLQLFPYDDTTNNGGVYILAVCQVPSSPSSGDGAPGVAANDCKYDAFKVREDPDDMTPPASDLEVTKDATPTFTRDLDWAVSKSQTTSATPINASGSTANVDYSVTATWSILTDTYAVSGTITVLNPNSFEVTGVTVTDDVLSDTADSCSVTTGSYTGGTVSSTDGTIPAETSVQYPYTCTYSANPASLTETNEATATWSESNALPSTTASGTAEFTFPTPTVTHGCTTVKDAFNGGAQTTLGTFCYDGTSSGVYSGSSPLSNFLSSYSGANNRWTLTYRRAVPAVANTCTTYPNTASISADGDLTDNSSSASVTVCGRIANGFTLGFWSNKNGQAVLCPAKDPAWRSLLNGGSGVGDPFLRNAAGTFYKVPITGTCANAHSNFSSWLLNANAVNMSYMLSAQLAATMLDVSYKGMLGTACIAGINGQPITINALIANAITFLKNNPNTTASGAARDTATLYKNIFDGLNNNLINAVPGCV